MGFKKRRITKSHLKELKNKVNKAKETYYAVASNYGVDLATYREQCQHRDLLQVDPWPTSHQDEYGCWGSDYYTPGFRVCLICGKTERATAVAVDLYANHWACKYHDEYTELVRAPLVSTRKEPFHWFLRKIEKDFFVSEKGAIAPLGLETVEALRKADLSYNTYSKEYYAIPWEDRPKGY